jgi:hypothetical protein
MRTVPGQERRLHPRFPSEALSARVRLKGQFNQTQVDVLDFNRFGLAISIDRPLPKDQVVFIALDDGQTSLPRVIGVVHNCLAQVPGYRCGILFRTQSGLQFDRELVEAQLGRIEMRLAEALEAPLGRSGLAH